MTKIMNSYDFKINNAMGAIRNHLARIGWENKEGTVSFKKSGESYEISLLVVNPEHISNACESGGICWGGNECDPAIYAFARAPQEKNITSFLGQLNYLNEIRIDQNPFVSGIAPDKQHITLVYENDSRHIEKTTWPFAVNDKGPQIGLGLIGVDGRVSPVEAMSDIESPDELFENSRIDNAIEIMTTSIDNYGLALGKLPEIAMIQGLRYINNEDSRGDFGHGSVARLLPGQDKREILIKLLPCGAVDGTLAMTGEPFLATRRHTPDYNSVIGALYGGRSPDEFGLGMTPTSVETLGKDISEIMKAMFEEYEQYPPQPPVGVEPENHLPGTPTTSTEQPPIYA